MKKIAVTGCNGFLGARVVRYYQEKYQVISLSHSIFDITKEMEVMRKLEEVKPDVLLHCAAISDTGYAQTHPEESYQINVKGSVNLAKACKEQGTKFIYMSSDQVYNAVPHLGDSKEDMPVTPANIYGQHKLEAEGLVADLLEDAIGLRLTWMYDMPVRGVKVNPNLICNLLHAAWRGQSVVFSPNDHRGITYVYEVIENLEKLFGVKGGVYNFGSMNDRNTYEVGLYTQAKLGIVGCVQKGEEVENSKIRNLCMDMSKVEAEGVHIHNTIEGIDRCLKEYDLIR